MNDLDWAEYLRSLGNSIKGPRGPRTPLQFTQQRFADGGLVEGPGTGTSDSVPGHLVGPNGETQPVALSDGEFVITNKAVKNLGSGDVNRGADILKMLMKLMEKGDIDEQRLMSGLNSLMKANK